MNDNFENNTNIPENEPPKKIVVISGDGNLDISDVKDHLNIEQPTSVDPTKKIVIPPDNSKKS